MLCQEEGQPLLMSGHSQKGEIQLGNRAESRGKEKGGCVSAGSRWRRYCTAKQVPCLQGSWQRCRDNGSRHCYDAVLTRWWSEQNVSCQLHHQQCVLQPCSHTHLLSGSWALGHTCFQHLVWMDVKLSATSQQHEVCHSAARDIGRFGCRNFQIPASQIHFNRRGEKKKASIDISTWRVINNRYCSSACFIKNENAARVRSHGSKIRGFLIFQKSRIVSKRRKRDAVLALWGWRKDESNYSPF